jgi:hypothetical protein
VRTAENNGALRASLIGVVIAHLVALFWHYSAHTHIPVPLSALQIAFVAVVILVLPVVGAGLLLWTNRKRTAAWLILLSMFGSLVFGFVNHFMLPSPDYVLAVPAHAWRYSFVVSAAFLVVTETSGTVLGVVAVQRWRRTMEVGTRALVEATEPASAHQRDRAARAAWSRRESHESFRCRSKRRYRRAFGRRADSSRA